MSESGSGSVKVLDDPDGVDMVDESWVNLDSVVAVLVAVDGEEVAAARSFPLYTY